MHPLYLCDDVLLPHDRLSLAPGQMGLLSGFGVFSTLHVTRGVLFEWERHLARMQRDARAIALAFPEDAGGLHASLVELCRANGAAEATLRVAVVRNTGGMWAAPAQRPTTVVAFTRPLTQWGQSARLSVVPHGRHAASPFSTLKVLSWVHNLSMYEAAKAGGFDEALLLNERGEVAECTSANVFLVRGEEVCTPPRTSGCLPGITRELLLDAVRVAGVSVVERVLEPASFAEADGVFITSSTRDLLPVSAIEGVHLRPPRGDVRARLSEAFSRHRDAYVAART